MNRIKKLLIAAGAVLALASITVTALAADFYGSSAAGSNKTYTLTEMLTYAVQDEELAYAEYAKINEKFGNNRPFANIVRAEQTHIAALEKLFDAHNIARPDNKASDFVTVPASMTDALNAGIQAEKDNIAMYEKFLSQSLPDDVKTVFTALKNASVNHLAAFERSLSGSAGNTAQYGRGNRGNGMMNGSGACVGGGSCTGSANGRMAQGGGGGQRWGQNGTGTCPADCAFRG